MRTKYTLVRKIFGPKLTLAEGLVMGVGAKLFTLAGPVLVYGICGSIIVGLITFAIEML